MRLRKHAMPRRKQDAAPGNALNFNNQVTLIIAVEQFIQHLRCVLQSFDHIDSIIELAFLAPAGQRANRLGGAMPIVKAQKSFLLGAFEGLVKV